MQAISCSCFQIPIIEDFLSFVNVSTKLSHSSQSSKFKSLLSETKPEDTSEVSSRQFGMGGVDYDTIYLSIGVAATALFIIETLYKAYTVFINSNSGRMFSDSDEILEKYSQSL